MGGVLKREFCWHNFQLQYDKPEAFCEAQWKWPRVVFVIYRVLITGYALFSLIEYLITVSQMNLAHNIMAFLTTWTYILETMFFIIGAVLAIVHYVRPNAVGAPTQPRRDSGANGHVNGEVNRGFGDDSGETAGTRSHDAGKAKQTNTQNGYTGDSTTKQENGGGSQSLRMSELNSNSDTHIIMDNGHSNIQKICNRKDSAFTPCLPWYVKMYWVLANAAQIFPVVVTAVYFSTVYDKGGVIELHDINIHGLNSALIFIDVAVCARPVRLLHFFHAVVYGCLYILFSVIYWSQDHTKNVVYAVLDWNSPGIAVGVVLGLCLIGIPLIQLLHFGLFRLRLFVYKKIYGEDYQEVQNNSIATN